MSHGPDLPLPPARALQGWSRELAALRPRRFWFGRFLFHHLEALVETARDAALDPLLHVLLSAVAAGDSPAPAFDPQIQARLLQELTACGLLHVSETGWQLTPAGRAALDAGSFVEVGRQRRSFWFVDNAACSRPPHFLLPQRSLDVTVAPDGWTFPVEALAACVRQPAQWKQRHHFPEDVRAVVELAAAPDDWRAVMIDRAEQFLGVVVESGESGLKAFSVRPDTWGLEREPPAFALTAGWDEVLPDLAVDQAPDAWCQAWQAWCQPRGVVPADADACRLEYDGQRLLVRAPKKLTERLRTARGEPLKNEAWLLAGAGRLRRAAQLAVSE
jgi:hypothetical protein